MAETSIISALATQFGAPGLLIGYMVWDRLMRRKDEQAARAEDLAMQKDRTEADKSLAASMSALATTIQQERK
ncbi:hypothetical protein [Sphingobium aromaticiconvertens]|uniref:hypothetical protein n=1 Tax=Sphingobium aromaticiconvertens TaxID=365341 RepID=UPI00301AB40F